MEPSYAAGATDVPLLDETIGANFERTVAAYGDREALVELASGRRWTWSELNADVDAFAIGLVRKGIRKGDRVGIWSPNCAEWTIVQYATAKIGAILVNINPAYRTHELAYALNQSGTTLLISATAFKTSDYRGMVEEVREQTPVEQVVYIGTSDWTDHNVHDPGVTLLELLAWTIEPDDPINIQYTSGTTGYPKGATLSHRNILNNGYFVTETINFTHEDRLCIPVPFYHCFGMVMGNLGCTTHGATMVIPGPAFDPEQTLRAVEEERCTGRLRRADDVHRHAEPPVVRGAGPVLAAHRDHGRLDLPGRGDEALRQRHAHGGGVHRLRHDRDLAGLLPDAARRRPRAPYRDHRAGAPARGDQDRRPGHRRDRRAGETGEFCTRGYSVMLGYWNDPDKTAEAIDAEGWMHTGDLAVMRADGYCNIVGRIKDMVIRGGENIYPREIEEFLYAHPDIEDVQVIGVPDARYGEELCAWIKVKAGAEPLDAAAVREYATGKLAHYKIPRYVMVVEEFPMTVTGKIRKVQMREESAHQLGLE